MSREYMVLIADEPNGHIDVQGVSATIFMRFTEPPPEDFLERLAAANKGKRVYCLLGASTWHKVEKEEEQHGTSQIPEGSEGLS